MAKRGMFEESTTTIHFQDRTGFKLGQEHDHECGQPQKLKVQHEEKGKFELATCKVYRSLHHHSTYSFLDGFALPDAHIRRAAELGMESLALTEHGNISSWAKLEQAGVDQGVKPIFGCELYTGATSPEKRGQRKFHLTVLAATQVGVKNLMALVSLGWQQFYYEPTVSFDDLVRFKEGLIIMSGCTGSHLACSLVGGKNILPEDASYARAKKVAARYKKEFGDSYYLEVQTFPELDNTRQINTQYERMGQELGIKLVASGDVHYTKPNENELQQILHNVRGGHRKTLEEMSREWGYDVQLSPPMSDMYVLRRLRATGLSKAACMEALHSTQEIADRCNVTLPKMEPLKFPVPEPYTSVEECMQAWVREGWERRRISDRENVGEYVRQLKHEIKTVSDKDFVDYFMIVADLVKFAKDSGIAVGPARGSAAASIFCYLLRITEVDSLAFPNMLFERFIEPNRKDLPDIDLDFDDRRRHEIEAYAVAKYGRDCVGNIGTFTTYKSKLALDDVGRVYRIPKFEVETVKELLLERSSGDLRANATLQDTVSMFEAAAEVFRRHPQLAHAATMEGQVKGMGVHAAGLVVASGPITQSAATYEREVGGVLRRVLSVDKYDAEYLNLLKIDILGLSTLGVINRCLDYIGKPLSWLYEIPLDDEQTIAGFKNNDVVGIFQFDGRALRGVTAELKPDNFLEICDITALARPGPLHNGAAAEYIDLKHGRKQPRSYHPLVDDIVHYTHGQIVYQEQILRVCGEIGGFDHVHRATVRKIISKKLGEQEFNRWWSEFRKGALDRGVSESDAKDIWNACITAGAYAFNVAHATAYGMLSWWTMYLKQHHPVEFFASALAGYGEKKQLELLRDATRHDVEIRPPDPAFAGLTWSPHPEQRAVLAGFSQIKGIGEKMAAVIIDLQERGEIKEWKDIAKGKGIGPKTVTNILEWLDNDDPFEIHKLSRAVQEVDRFIRDHPRSGLPRLTHTAIDIPYARDGVSMEVVWCGMIIKRNLKELFELHYSRTGEELDPDTVRDPDLNEWVVMWGDDGTDLLTITIDRWKYPKFRDAVWGMKPETDMVVIRGIKKGSQSRRAIYVHDMWVLGDDEDEEDDTVTNLD